MRIGIDLGGTKTEVIALDDAGHTLTRRRVATPQGDYAATVSTIAALVEAVESETGQRGSLGVGIPGAESLRTGLIKNANSTCLIGRPLKHDLQTRLDREVRLANDANCFTLSEAVDGAGRGTDIVFGIILGTGVGGGIAIHQQILVGSNAIAGEWGHNPLPAPTPDDLPLPPCYCGRAGCIEAYLSGPALAADHQRHHGEALDAATIATRAAAGDAACQASLRRYIGRLGRSLASVINLIDPEVIVLGGGLSHIAALYSALPAACAPFVFSDVLNTKFLPPVHGDSSGVRGAAWLWN